MLSTLTITDPQQAAPNMLNYRVGSNAAIPGSYSNSIYTAGTFGTTSAFTQGFNQVMMQQAEHFDPFIQRSLIEQPRFWYDRIPAARTRTSRASSRRRASSAAVS